MRVLITGIGGSGGSYLAEYIAAYHPEVQIHGFARWHSTTQDNLRSLMGKVTLHEVDLLDALSVLYGLEMARPHVIFHLASHANVKASFITPLAVLNNNIMGTANLLEAAWGLCLGDGSYGPIIQLCSSSEVYGQVDPADVPIKETLRMQPASPYAVSKATQDLLGWSYFNSYGLRVIRTRMFAYVNPRRTDLFATSFARQIALIEQGAQRVLKHGNLESVRTMVDVRDAMRAYWLAAEFCEPGEAYNIGGTDTLKVGEVLERLIAMATVPIPCEVDPELLRPADVTLQIPDTRKFTKATGWCQQHSLEASLKYLLDYWRVKCSLR